VNPFTSPKKRPLSFASTFAMGLGAGLAVLTGLWSCELFSNGGGGSETETRVFAYTGQTLDSDGLPLRNVHVTVWPDTLLLDPDSENMPDPIAQAYSDADGKFGIDSLPNGSYRAYYKGTGPDGLLYGLQSIYGDADAENVALPPQTLAAGATLTGKFDSASPGIYRRYVQVYGLPRFARCDSAGGFRLDGIPAGTYRLRYLTREPFRLSVNSDSIPVSVASRLRIATAQSLRGVKLTPSVGQAGLTFAGISRDNPVIFDNELCDNTTDMPYLLPLVAQGHLQLKGWIVTKDFAVHPERTLAQQIADCLEMREIARHSGFHVNVEPVAGSGAILNPSFSGRLIDMQPQPSAGASLILAEAARATHDRPLMILAGGPLTTIASAYLLDPTVVNRVVVVAMYSDRINAYDSLANYLVAQKFRFIHWGRGYVYPFEALPDQWARLPTHASGLFARSQLQSNGRGFGDLPLAWLLLEPKAFSGVTAQNLRLPPLRIEAVPQGQNGDFWDIERSHVDFDFMTKAFYDSMANWRPLQRSLGVVHGLSFNSSTGTQVMRTGIPDSLYAQLADKGEAVWEFDASTQSNYVIKVTARNTQAGVLKVIVNDTAQHLINLSASASWRVDSLTLPLDFGPLKLKLQADGAPVDLLEFDISPRFDIGTDVPVEE
jgi:hypothetical protein